MGQIMSTLQNKRGQKRTIHHSSSTVFLAALNLDQGIDTEISLLNHFHLKREILDVIAYVELFDVPGNNVGSFEVKIDEPRSYAFRLSEHMTDNFLGSLYIFFKSSHNLAVPFCAVMSSIKAAKSVCGVHTYGRRLEENELGTGIELSETVETGWTLRDSASIKSFAVLHGGAFEISLDIRVECANHVGEIRAVNLSKVLKPYGTLLLFPQDLVEGLVDHLADFDGHAKVYIKGLSGIFPRMLVGNFAADLGCSDDLLAASEIQFTHTNFDFSVMSQPDAQGDFGYINQPELPKGHGIIYPVVINKDITVDKVKYVSDTLRYIDIEAMRQAEVRSLTGNLPSRFIAAAVGRWDEGRLESECSTGTFIEDYLKVPCHWHWGLFKPGFENGVSTISIFVNDFNQKTDLSRKLQLRLYSEDGMIFDKELDVVGNMVLPSSDLLPSKPIGSTIWYVLSGEVLEDLHIFSTFYPEGKAGFTEHAF